jgi:hypothetical protein
MHFANADQLEDDVRRRDRVQGALLPGRALPVFICASSAQWISEQFVEAIDMFVERVEKTSNYRHEAVFDPKRPFNDLPLLPPAAEVETKAVLKACIEARAALEGLKQAGARLPNQAVLINSIPLLEAQASSEIENIVTTSDALFRYAQIEDQTPDPATKEALRYRTALERGFRSLSQRPISCNTAIEVCTQIRGVAMQVRRVPGTALGNQSSGEVVYTPPEGEALLREKLSNWERFIHQNESIDPPDSHDCRTLPVRSHSSLHRWEWPNWSSTQSADSRAAWPA